MRLRPALSLLVLAALGACSPQGSDNPPDKAAPVQAEATVQATDAWCRPTAPGARVGACYLTLTASGDDRLTAVSTPAAERAEIHTMSMDGGVMRMRPLPDGLALPAGQAVALAPGAEHLMLMELAAPLAEGDRVSLSLNFAAAPAATVEAVVRAPASAQAPSEGHGDPAEHGSGHGAGHG